MQKLFILLLLCVSTCCFAQRRGSINTLNADNYKFKGICNGVRLDTLSNHFIAVTIRVSDEEKLGTVLYKVDYGQGATDNSYNDLKDENGKYIEFVSFAVLLNFMSYNGWIYQNSIINQKVYTGYPTATQSDEIEKLIFYKENK